MENRLHDIVIAISAYSSEQAFGQLYRHYFPGLLSFATSIIKNEPAAEEIVEDVFVKIWENRKNLSRIKHLSPYIYTATKNTCLNYLKSRKGLAFDDIGDEYPVNMDNGEVNMLQDENIKKILQAVNSLPPKCRLIFRLIKDEGMTYSQVAGLLDISERTVNAQMTIAITRISDALHKSLPEFSIYYSKKKSG